MIFTWKEGRIDVIPEARKLKVIIALREKDKTNTRTYYHRYLGYVYYVWSPKSIYANQFENVRKAKYCIEVLKKPADFWKEMEEIPEVKDFIEWYQDNLLTQEERMVISVDRDIEQYIDHLNSIPFRQANGEENIDTKMKAIKTAKELLLYRKELRSLLMGKKAKNNKKKVRTRLFEE